MTTTAALTVIVDGEPVPKGRPRTISGVTKYGKTYTRTFTPQRTEDAEQRIQWVFKATYPGFEPIQGDVCVEMGFAIGVRRSKRDKQPDIDNLQKLVLDALNTLAWMDDKQVVDVHARLDRDAETPRTIVTIRPIAQEEAA